MKAEQQAHLAELQEKQQAHMEELQAKQQAHIENNKQPFNQCER
jgi:hypothetical protein